MTPVWYALVTNLAVVSLFFALWALAQHRLEAERRVVRNLALGVFMGVGAVASMFLAIELRSGVLVDLRSSLIAVAAFFGGPIAGLVAGTIAALYRLAAGGQGAVAGLTGIGLAAAIGFAGWVLRRGSPPTVVGVLVLGIAVSGTILVLLVTVPASVARDDLAQFGLPLTLLALVATVIAGLIIQHGSRLAHDRELLRAALAETPDHYYVKNRASQFTVANQVTAEYFGLARPARVIGKTDFDLLPAEQARRFYDVEQEIMASGRAMIDHEAKMADAAGTERWFSSSKVPLHNAEGDVIGIAGVSRDITERRRLEAELVDSRNLLSYAVAEMSDGLAMFDRAGILVYCNDRYRSLFPITSYMRQPGTHIRAILETVVETGEQMNLGDPEQWIEGVMASMRVNGEEQVSLLDGRWLHIRTRPTPNGASMVVVSDVTKIKRAERELMTLTGQLRLQATTDGLTGLLNRRAFDSMLEEEVTRSSRDRTPISLVMCDVDHFKVYNDEYGHPAGDECLRIVGGTMKAALLRQSDVAARYGGEEFAAILPNTDEDSAFVVAERVRQSLFDLRPPHGKSEHGVVTLSAGVSTYTGDADPRSAQQLIGWADAALYDAKAAGRNRCTGWHPRHEVKRVQRSR